MPLDRIDFLDANDVTETNNAEKEHEQRQQDANEAPLSFSDQ